MTTERTYAMIKPDAVAAGHVGEIIAAIEASGLKIRALELMHLTPAQARGFYRVHVEKPFFPVLLEFMTSGPVVAMVLEGSAAITRWRALMGPTDPSRAEPEALRARFGTDITRNAVHGSDAHDTADAEIAYMFGGRFLDGLV
ncbi:MAG: nucleoside-diphosphate kinase [Deltaproteobacteria bacterium HGW-Deltaproteobacteria-17]|nr:MAG: nucleoside-diphosphate kinase [Deltaproteobacteria bacterium HGW-Deltaproteobacteria-17]